MDIKKKILSDLEFGIPPTYKKYGITVEDFTELLNELQAEGLVTFDTIKDHPVFEGEAKNIRITDKGKEYIKSIK